VGKIKRIIRATKKSGVLAAVTIPLTEAKDTVKDLTR
jgi:hypothetical protein